MERNQLAELHYIAPIANLGSILRHGILSHRLVETIEHISVAAVEIQDRRAGKVVPGGSPLHSYANLYFHARNPMMSKRRERHAELCVLRVSTDVLDIEGAVVSSQNASSDYALFRGAPGGLAIVDYEQVFAHDWRDPNQIAYWRKKSIKCAEVLVPNRVVPDFVEGVYCSCEEGGQSVRSNCGLDVTIDSDLFFVEGG